MKMWQFWVLLSVMYLAPRVSSEVALASVVVGFVLAILYRNE